MRTKGLQTLKDVKLDEISFVGKGDNPEAHIVLLKNKPVSLKQIEKNYHTKNSLELLTIWCENNPTYISKSEAQTFAEIVSDQEVKNKIWNMIYTLEDSVSSIMYDDECEDKKSKIKQSVDEFKSAITSITKKGENDMSVELKEKLEKAEARVEELEKENETLKAACSAKDEEKKKLEESMKKEEESKIDKSALPEAVVKHLEEIEKRAEEDRKEVAKLRDAETTREYVGKAAELQTIGKVDEIGSLLKSVAAVSKEVAENVFELLKAADAKIRTGGLLKEVGGEDTTGGSTAYDKIVAKAAELRKTNPNLTEAQAFTKVYDTDAELRKAYIAERKSN